MASMLPQMQFFDNTSGINAFRGGLADSVEATRRNVLQQAGQVAADEGLDAGARVAMRGGEIGTGIKLQDMSLDRQVKLYDFMGRGAAAADTPEKWQAYIGTLARTFGPDSVKGFEDFRTRESAILMSMSAKEQAALKMQQQNALRDQDNKDRAFGLEERKVRALEARTDAGPKPVYKTMKTETGADRLVKLNPDGTATPIKMEGDSEAPSLSKNIRGGLENLRKMADTYDDASFSNAVGPWQGSTPDSLVKGAAINLARAGGEILNFFQGGGNNPTEVRSNIQGATETLAAAIKPLIRKPGEGAWTDADQARLVSIVGDLAQARDKGEFKRRLNNVRDRISSNFGIQIDFDAAGGEAPKPQQRNTWTDPVTKKTYNVRDGKLYAQ